LPDRRFERLSLDGLDDDARAHQVRQEHLKPGKSIADRGQHWLDDGAKEVQGRKTSRQRLVSERHRISLIQSLDRASETSLHFR